MALDVKGSESLYWKAGIDYSGMKGETDAILRIITKLKMGIAAIGPFGILGVMAGAAFSAAAKASYGFAAEFGAAMNEVKTISKAAQQDFDGLSQGILELSKRVPQSATQLAKAYYEIVSAGFDGAKAMEILEQSAKGAVAGFTDTFTVADAATRILNSYGEAAGNIENVMDKMFNTVKVGVIRMEELSHEIGDVVGIAAQAGVSFNELMAAVAEASKTVLPSQTTRGLRGIFAAVIQQADEAKEAAKSVELDFSLDALKTKGLLEFLADVYDKTGGNIEILNKLFGRIEGLNVLLATFRNNGEQFRQTLDQMTNSTRANADAFEIAMQKQGNQVQIFKNNVMAAIAPIGKTIRGWTTNWITSINDMISGLGGTYRDLAAMSKEQAFEIERMAGRYKGLQEVKERTKEQDLELKTVTQQLYAYIGDEAVKNITALTGAMDLYNIAMERSGQLNKTSIEMRLRGLEIDKLELENQKYKLETGGNILEKIRTSGLQNDLAMARASVFSQTGLGGFKPTGNEEADLNQIRDALKNINYEKAGVVSLKGEINKLLTGQMNLVDAKKLYAEVTQKALDADTNYRNAQTKFSETIGKKAIDYERLTLKINETNTAIQTLRDSLANINQAIDAANELTVPEKETDTPFDFEAFQKQIDGVRAGYESFFKVVQTTGRENAEVLFRELIKNGESYGAFLDTLEVKYKGNSEALKQIAIERSGYMISREQAMASVVEEINERSKSKILKINEKYNKLLLLTQTEAEKQMVESARQHAIEMERNSAIKDARIRLGIENGQERVEIEKGYDDQILLMANEADRKLIEQAKTAALQEYDAQERIRKMRLDRARYWGEAELGLAIENLKAMQREYEGNEKLVQSLGEQITTLIERLGVKRAEANEDILDAELDSLRNASVEELRIHKRKLQDKLALVKKNSIEERKIRDEIQETTDAIFNKQIEKIRSIGDAIQELGRLINTFDVGFGKTISDIGSIVQQISMIKTSVDDKNTWGAVVGGIGVASTAINLAMTAVNALNGGMKDSERTINTVNDQLKRFSYETQKLYDQLRRSTGVEEVKNTIAVYTQLGDTIDANMKTLNEFKVTWGPGRFKLSDLLGPVTSDNYEELLRLRDKLPFLKAGEFEAINQLINAITDAKSEMADLQDEYEQLLTGTTAPALAESIADGFRQGFKSVEQFGDKFEDVMRDAMMGVISREITSRWTAQWYADFVRYSESSGLDTMEVAALRRDWDNIILQSSDLIKQLEAATGINLSMAEETKKSGLQGAIEGITEETAGILAGQFNAVRIDIKSILGLLSVQYANYVRLLESNLGIAATSKQALEYAFNSDLSLRKLVEIDGDIGNIARLISQYDYELYMNSVRVSANTWNIADINRAINSRLEQLVILNTDIADNARLLQRIDYNIARLVDTGSPGLPAGLRAVGGGL